MLLGSLMFAQKNVTNPPGTAKLEDVDTLPHITAAIYDVISGPAGTRDWERFHSLFYPGAEFIPLRTDKTGIVAARIHTTDEFISAAKTYFEKQGFYESGVANRVEQWDHIAQVWSTYESRHSKGEKPFQRGINSIQLMNDGKRWWVLNIFWEGEENVPIPKKYLH